MTPETFYKATPVSEKPEKSNHYFCFDPNRGIVFNEPCVARYVSQTDSWFVDDDSIHPDFWLRPVTLKDVPTEEQMEEKYSTEYPNLGNIEYPHPNKYRKEGALWMRDELLPLIPSLQSKVEEMESTKTSLLDYDKNMARENAEKKQEIQELQWKVERLEKENEDLKSHLPPIDNTPQGVKEARKYMAECEKDLGFMGSPKYNEANKIVYNYAVLTQSTPTTDTQALDSAYESTKGGSEQ